MNSISIDKELWLELKKISALLNTDMSKILEGSMRDLVIYEEIDELIRMDEANIDFEPIKAKGLVSDLVRVERDEREDSISG